MADEQLEEHSEYVRKEPARREPEPEPEPESDPEPEPEPEPEPSDEGSAEED